MTFFNALFNQDPNRPYRWSLENFVSGSIFSTYWLPDNKFVHYTEKANSVSRKIDVINGLNPIRRRDVSFLTTRHEDFYEDGKYTEVYNDPINYIFTDDTTYTDAYKTAEARIGNYRKGVRRDITHLGGTLSEAELDQLEDEAGTTLASFPLMPPLPTTDFTKPFRTKLITSDVGYVDYVKAAHNSETSTARTAVQSKQSTGFQQFIFDAGNVNMKYESTATPISISKVQIEDIETVLDAAINTATDADIATFLPTDGTYVIYNIAAKTVIRSDPTSGISLEQYDGTGATLGALQSSIAIDQLGGIQIAAGTTDIVIPLDGAVTIDAGSNNLNVTAADVNITGTLTVSGAVDFNSTLNVSGVTTHGG